MKHEISFSLFVAFLGAYLASSLFLLKGVLGSKYYEIFALKGSADRAFTLV